MSVDCKWVETNLEALFCDRLTDDENRSARAHIASCALCGKESQALNAIDPLIKNYFRRELEIARRPRVVHRGRIVALGAAAAASAALLLALIQVPPPAVPRNEIVAVQPSVENAVPGETPPKDKDADPAEIARLKPQPGPAAPDRLAQTPAMTVSPNAPAFLVADPAGYSHQLEEYRGRVVVIGVWSHNQPEVIANMERLYKAHAVDPKFRFLGITNEHGKPANTTFPVMYNQGSKLLGAQSGEFLLLGENGAIELRGSLLNDFDSLSRALRSK